MALRGFALNVKYLFSPGFTAETGERIFLDTANSYRDIEKRIQSKTSEVTVVQIVNQELSRVSNMV